MNHFLLMSLYAALVGAFFALLAYRRPADRLRLFAIIFGALVGGATVLAWIMYFFPGGPPTPFP